MNINDRFLPLLASILLIAQIAYICSMVYFAHQCTATGGTAVRGMVWLECIR